MLTHSTARAVRRGAPAFQSSSPSPVYHMTCEGGSLEEGQSINLDWNYSAGGTPGQDEDFIGAYNDRAYSGSYSYCHQYAPDSTWVENRFWYDQIWPEFWHEMWVWIPSNYSHGTGSGGNKWMDFWGGWDDEGGPSYAGAGMGRPDMLFECWKYGETTDSRLRVVTGNTGSPTELTNVSPFISASGPFYRNQWNHWRLYVHGGTANGEGTVKLWLGDTLYVNETGAGLYPYYNYPTGPNYYYFDAGYQFGWANIPFSVETRFSIDEWKLYTTDPGW